MDNLQEKNLDNKYFKGFLKSFDDKNFEQIVIFKFVLTDDNSIYAEMIGNDELMPVYYRCDDGILKGYIMHDEYSRYYVQSPFDIDICKEGLISKSNQIGKYQIDKDVVGYALLNNRFNEDKKTHRVK